MVRIITDSSCNLTPQQAKDLNIDLIPLNVTFEDDTVILDGVDMTNKEFFQALAQCKHLPKTSQPSPEAFIQVFEDAKSKGDEAVAVLIGSNLSGTFQCAKMAAETAEFEDAWFVDTFTASIGMRLLLDRALELRTAGQNAAQIAQALEELKDRIRVLLIANDLENLHKGGRLSAAATIAGGALGIKPVLQLYKGKLGLAGKARGMPGALVAMFKLMEADQDGMDFSMPTYVAYSDQHATAEPIRRYLTQNLKLDSQKVPVCGIGAAIGTHVGAGACGIAFFVKE